MEDSDPITFKVPPGTAPDRADKILAHYHPNLSRSLIQRAFESGQVLLKETLVIEKRHKVSTGDTLTFKIPQATTKSLQPVSLPLNVLYEDSDLIAINKVRGQVVHPGSGTGPDTLVHALLHHCRGKLSTQADATRPGVVHRLDKETSGVILFAKTDPAYLKLNRMFANRTIEKEYLALVSGVPELVSGTIEQPIARHPKVRTRMCVATAGRPAHTDWCVEASWGKKISLLRCYPHTGRTHQIRVHLSYLGCPIVGDATYGYRPIQGLAIQPKEVQLHAHRLKLQHPITGKTLRIEADLPQDLSLLLNQLRKEFER